MDYIADTPEAWEEGTLGNNPEFAVRLDPATWASEQRALDEALGLKAISIRLETELIEEFKMIAQYHKIGYQPLMRQALHRFAKSELKQMAADALAAQEEETAKKAA